MSLVLVIDDDAEFRLMVRRLLEMEGYEVAEAGTGVEGIEKFRALSPDLIVTDIFMPEKSGIATIVQIREENSDIRIVAVSGSGGMASADFLASAADAGADHTLTKPFRAQQLIDAVTGTDSRKTRGR